MTFTCQINLWDEDHDERRNNGWHIWNGMCLKGTNNTIRVSEYNNPGIDNISE